MHEWMGKVASCRHVFLCSHPLEKKDKKEKIKSNEKNMKVGKKSKKRLDKCIVGWINA